jgi:hypothetical protein
VQVLEHILWYNWSPIPPNAKPLRWYDLSEIRIKFWNDLYRINYFVDLVNNFMVIVNWYYKPDWRNESNSYNKSKKKSLDKEIRFYIDQALELKKQYFLNKWNYELFN